MKRVITDSEIQMIDEATGEIVKSVKLATKKQVAYIRILEEQADVKPKSYTNLTLWQAMKIIDKLKDKRLQKLNETRYNERAMNLFEQQTEAGTTPK